MNPGHSQGLSFVPTGTSLVLGLILLAIAGSLCWLAWSRSGYRRSTGWLELLRFALVALVIATLCQPEWLAEQPATERPTLAVLWDQSSSMETKDVFTNANVQTRAEVIQPLLEESVWKPTEDAETENLEVVFEPFSSQLDPAEEATDLNTGLTKVIENHSNLRGVVLLSDGDWNVGGSPAEAATQYRMQGVPVFAVGVGSKVPLPDLAIVSMDAPTLGVVGKPLRIPFTVRSTMGQDRDVSVTLSVDENPDINKVVRVPAMGEIQQSLTWTPGVTGDFTLTLQIPDDPKDLNPGNNALSAPISIRQEQLKVVVIESYPRWEYRYLRNALERDPGVEITCLLYHPELLQSGGGRSYIKEFPSTSELNRFDVVFLGDVGIDPKQLSNQEAQEIKQLVSAQAAGLVFLPGRYGFQSSLASSPLADLLPVVLDPARTTGVGSPVAGHFALTGAGQRSLLTRLADSDPTNAGIWNKLPGFHWYAAVQRAAAGAEVLAVHDQEATTYGRVPLIVTKTYGTGKVLFMGTDSAWRWREGVEDRYHYRFWGQVARWMAYQRQKAQGKSMRLFASPDRPRVDDQVTLNANVLDALGNFIDKGTVTVQALSPTGKTRSIRLQPGENDARGLFMGSFKPSEPGNYKLIASNAETGATVETDLSVQGLNRERQGALARFDVLEEIASITEGKVVPASEIQSLLDHLAALPEPEPTIHRTRIWAHPIWGGILIFLMGAFWTGRKLIGEV